MTDTELIRAAQNGDAAAYDALVRRYQSVAFRTAWLILGDADDAQDVTQGGFLKAWLGIGGVDPRRPFQPWLLTVVANEARNRRRSRRRWLARVLPEDRVELIAEPGPSLEQAVADRDETAVVLRELARLEETDRVTLWCRHVLGLSEQETADVMACAVGTVKSRTHRALGRLRARLGETAVGGGRDD